MPPGVVRLTEEITAVTNRRYFLSRIPIAAAVSTRIAFTGSASVDVLMRIEMRRIPVEQAHEGE